MSPSKILCPIDGSPASLRAVDFAIEQLDRNPGGSLLLLHVLHMGALDIGGLSEAMPSGWLDETASQAAAEALNDAIGKCESAGVSFKAHSRTGQTAETIKQVAREEDAGQIVMGSRGLGSLEGLLLGSVATRVIHLTELPVTLVK